MRRNDKPPKSAQEPKAKNTFATNLQIYKSKNRLQIKDTHIKNTKKEKMTKLIKNVKTK